MPELSKSKPEVKPVSNKPQPPSFSRPVTVPVTVPVKGEVAVKKPSSNH